MVQQFSLVNTSLQIHKKEINNMKISLIIKSVLLLATFVTPCYAATINYLDLPEQLRLRATENSNVVDGFVGKNDGYLNTQQSSAAIFESNFDTSAASMFSLLEFNNQEGSAKQSWLVRYELNASSKMFSSSNGNSVVEDYSGYIWLEAPDAITRNGENIFTLHDRQSSFSLTYNAAVKGAGFINLRPFGMTTGNMSPVDNGFCLGCDIDFTLNLIGFSYDENGNFTINSADTRALLFSSSSRYTFMDGNTSTSTVDLFVQPVPLPASAWLFASSLFVFWYHIKRAKKMSA